MGHRDRQSTAPALLLPASVATPPHPCAPTAGTLLHAHCHYHPPAVRAHAQARHRHPQSSRQHIIYTCAQSYPHYYPRTVVHTNSTDSTPTHHPQQHTHSWVSQCVALRNELVDDVEGRVHDKLVGARRDVVPLLLEHALEDRLLRAYERRRKRKWEARNEEERGAGV